MLLARLTLVDITAGGLAWRAVLPWAGAAVVLILFETGILRTAVILHNKRMLRDPEALGINVPSWLRASWVTCLAVLVDAGIVAACLGSSPQWSGTDLCLAFLLRLPVHTVVLAMSLPSTYREAMIVQIFEIAIAMTLAPLVMAIAVIVFLG
jgi:hypothetical protein